MPKSDTQPGADQQETTIGTVELMRRQMDLEAGVPGAQSTYDIVERIQENIITATSDDAVFAAGDAGAVKAEDLIDVPLALLDYNFNRSSFADQPGSLPVYAAVKALNLDTQEEFVFSIGSMSGMAQLFQFNRLRDFRERATDGGFPCAIKSKRTASGYDVLFFRPLTVKEKERVGVPQSAA